MAIPLKQSTASQEIPLGMFVDSTDGNTEETGLTIANTDIKLWKAGATTLASKNSGGATHISNGVYYATLDATDTDTLGPLVIFVHVSGALPIKVECVVLAANVYDSLIAASDKLQVDAQEWLGQTIATPTNNGVPEVDVTHFAGTAATASGGRPEVNATHWAGAATATNDVALATAPTNFASLAIDANGRVKVQSNLAKNVQATVSFLMKDSTNHAPATGLTVSVSVSVDRGAFAAATNSVTEEGNGWYSITLTQSEMNGDEIMLHCTATGADDTEVQIRTDP